MTSPGGSRGDASAPAVRVVVATHSYGRNGAAILLKTAVRHWISDLGWQVDAVVADPTDSAQTGVLDALGVTPVGTAVPAGRYDFALVNTAVHLGNLDGLSRLMPTVLWVHEGLTLLRNLRNTPGELTQSLALARRLIFQTRWQVDTVFRSFLHALPEERIALVPCGIDTSGAARLPDPRADFDGPVRVVCVGSVYARKRQMDLAAAVVDIARRRPIVCSFIGELDRADSFGESAKPFLEGHREMLRWIGGVDDRDTIALHHRQADIACFPSGDETFGIAPLEAGLWGLPVVLADLAPYREIGWKPGQNCLMHPVGDVKALGACLDALIDSPALRTRLARGANALARQYPTDRFLAGITTAVLDLP
jgi:glycosyltransferase involved in cell wall biosynthesis